MITISINRNEIENKIRHAAEFTKIAYVLAIKRNGDFSWHTIGSNDELRGPFSTCVCIQYAPYDLTDFVAAQHEEWKSLPENLRLDEFDKELSTQDFIDEEADRICDEIENAFYEFGFEVEFEG